MTIEIHQPETESLIQQRLQSGAFLSFEDVLMHALRSSKPPAMSSPCTSGAKDLVELFSTSPFAGMSMNFERDEDTGREIHLRKDSW